MTERSLFGEDDDNSMDDRHHRGTRRDRRREPMQLDRRIPIGLAVGMLFQIIAFVWWGASQAFELHDDTRRLELIEKFDNTMATQTNEIGERLARIEEKTSIEMSSLDRIESYIRRK